ncbi:MAG: cold shock domain-containing protein [Rhodobacteraceae bacterium]|nr:cold shock domain-containing protein [Paracoccaceae bacterium]
MTSNITHLSDQATRRTAGLVKWYDPVKGFGFFVDEESGADVLIPASALQAYGRQTLADDSWVEVFCVETSRGLQTREILVVEAPQTPFEDAVEGLSEAEYVSDEFRPARVKWFELDKGYGYAQVFGETRDCFFHVTALIRAGFRGVEEGEAILIRVAEGTKGPFAVEIAEWNAGASLCSEPFSSAKRVAA